MSLRETTHLTPRGPELEATADEMYSQLPEACSKCPWAFAVRCAINGERGVSFPATPENSRFANPIDRGSTSTTIVSAQAEQALDNIVSEAIERGGRGPSPDGQCCIDRRADPSAADLDYAGQDY
jgi:hypothetical protein